MIVKCPKCWVTVTLMPTEVDQDYEIEVLDCPEVHRRQRQGGSPSGASCPVLNLALGEAVAAAARATRATPLLTSAKLDE
jgi:hypothetical protein